MASSCSDVLVQTQISRLDTQLKRVAFLHLIHTKEDWQSTSSFSGSLGAIFDDIPIRATTDYNQFQQWQSEQFREDVFRLQDDEAHSLQTSFLPDTAIGAWTQCMGIQADSGGLALGVVLATPSRATIRLIWKMPRPTVGTTLHAVTIEESGDAVGGQRCGDWPLNDPVDADQDLLLDYARTPETDLIVEIKVTDEAGQTSAKMIRVPAEPTYSSGSRLEIAGPFGHVLPSSSTTLVCPGHYQPGRMVNLRLEDAKFKIDASHAIWITIGADLVGGQKVLPAVDLLYIPYIGNPPNGDDSPQPWHFSEVITVPWNGVISVTMSVYRAEYVDFGGQHGGGAQNSSLYATQGTLVAEPLPDLMHLIGAAREISKR